MGIEADFQRLRSEIASGDAAVAKAAADRLDVIEMRLLQLHQRLRLLEAHWGSRRPKLDEALAHPLQRSRVRRAKIPPRPKLMRECGEGIDPPLGDAKCLLMI